MAWAAEETECSRFIGESGEISGQQQKPLLNVCELYTLRWDCLSIIATWAQYFGKQCPWHRWLSYVWSCSWRRDAYWGLSVMLLSRQCLLLGSQWIFQTDNAKNSFCTHACGFIDRVCVLDWFACSPHLSPTKNIWSIIKRRTTRTTGCMFSSQIEKLIKKWHWRKTRMKLIVLKICKWTLNKPLASDSKSDYTHFSCNVWKQPKRQSCKTNTNNNKYMSLSFSL